LHHRFATSGTREPWPLRRGRTRFELPVSAVANTIEPLIAMVEHSVGIACLPDFAVRSQLERGTLISVLDKYMEHVGAYRVLWPSGRYAAPKVRVFVDHMAKHMFGERAHKRT
jgi:DNA-binding transcriptional LysR family regulator